MVDSNTVHFGLIGNPVTHSLSPLMHNQAFKDLGYNGIYLAFRVLDVAAAVKGIRALNFRGVSVTLPHKAAVMPYLDALDEAAAKIGAVNTIVNHNSKLVGYNTDCSGALAALKTKTTIQGKSIAIIGAGGAARAIGFGLVSEGACVTILNRSKPAGECLAADLNTQFLRLEEWQPNRFEVVINATSVGMHPKTDAIPVPEASLSKEILVMDIVYNPLKTRLLKAAEAQGCETINGVLMFVFQAAQQLELWTGLKAPTDRMQRSVIKALNRK